MGEHGSQAFFVFNPLLSTIRPRLLAISWSRAGLFGPRCFLVCRACPRRAGRELVNTRLNPFGDQKMQIGLDLPSHMYYLYYSDSACICPPSDTPKGLGRGYLF